MDERLGSANLDELGQAWLAMRRSTREEQEAAERFYEAEVFPRVVEAFRTAYSPEFGGRYFAVLFSVGTSWEPLVLTLSATQPQRALFLYTPDTERCIEKVLEKYPLGPARFDKVIVDPVDPTPIYQAIKEYYRRFRPSGHMAVDFTSGTKAMTSGAAMAGAVLGLDLIYVANHRYVAALRRPYPGSEYLARIQHPLAVLGDLEEQEAFRLAARHDWAAVRQIAASLQRRMPSPRFRALELLADAYQQWDSFNFGPAERSLGELLDWAATLSPAVVPEWLARALGRLKAQRQLLAAAARAAADDEGRSELGSLLGDGRAASAVVVSLFAGAERAAERERYDLAALLLYRAVELMGQRRLYTYGAKTGDFRPDGLPPPYCDGQALLGAVNEWRRRLRMGELAQLPQTFGLVMAYIILHVVGDPFARHLNLYEVAGHAEARNYGLLAHGLQVTSRARYERYREFVRSLVRRYLDAEGLPFDEWAELGAFVQPGPLT